MNVEEHIKAGALEEALAFAQEVRKTPACLAWWTGLSGGRAALPRKGNAHEVSALRLARP